VTIDQHADALAHAICEVLPGWVERCVTRLAPELREQAMTAGQAALVEVGADIRELLAADIDEQRTTPLALLRDAVRYPAGVLAAAKIPPVPRDGFDRERFPGDSYGLTPATWADVDPALSDPGLAWGAAKAFEHKRRHSS
jgi:hypothetical protein